jgi:signal peptidase I
MKKMTLEVQSWLRSLRNGVFIIIIPLLIVIVLRVFFFEIYKISSSSMEPTLLPGDIILASKMSYGARLLNPLIFFRQKKMEFVRTKGWCDIKKGDVFIFNWPQYYTFKDSIPNIYGICIVKRCYELPGNIVVIKNIELKNVRMKNEAFMEQKPDLFPHDSTSSWTLDNYGPLYVPAKGQSVILTKKEVSHYIDILRYENPQSEIKDSILFINYLPVSNYTFQHNYYFMLGDSFYNSEDSRYWGFVPDANIIGKAVVILFSLDPNEYGLKKIRYSRFFRLIH